MVQVTQQFGWYPNAGKHICCAQHMFVLKQLYEKGLENNDFDQNV